MADNLAVFMAENAVRAEHEKIVVSERFQSGGKPVEWEIKPITSQEDMDLRKDCMVQAKIPGKKRQYAPSMDTDKYMAKLAAACVVYPDLNSAALQDSYHVRGAEALLKTMLQPGEYANLVIAVQEINGFDKDLQELVDEAKN